MNKLIIFFSFLLSSIFFINKQSRACDICGCGVGSNYIGILPEYQSSIIGLRHRYNSMHTHLNPNGQDSYLKTKEQFHTSELYLGMQFHPKWRAFVSVPFHFITKENTINRSEIQGFGDPMAFAQYQIFNHKKLIKERLLVTSLWLSVGLKAPVGKYSNANFNASDNTNTFQLGTGSWDFVSQLMYDVRLQDWGTNLTMQYKINTTNPDQYYYGNKFQSVLQLYRKFAIGKDRNISPNIGYHVDYSSQDLKRELSVYSTGGIVQKINAGVELKLKKVLLGFNYQYLIAQKIGNGSVGLNNGMMMHIGYTL